MIERSFFSTYALELTFAFLFFCIVNFIVIFFIRNSEILKKKKQFIILLSAFDFIMIAAFVMSFIILKPQKISQRIAFMPTIVEGKVNRDLSFKLIEQIEHNFINQSQDNFIPNSVWWTYKALNPSEQLNPARYKELYKKINSTHIFETELRKISDQFQLQVSIEPSFKKIYTFEKMNAFYAVSQTIVGDLLRFLNEKENRPFKNYFDSDYIKTKQWLLDGKLDSLVQMSLSYPVADTTILANTNIAEAFIHKGYAISQYLDTDNPYTDDNYKKPFIEAQKRLFFFFNKDQQNFDLYPAMIKYFLYLGNFEDADNLIKAGLTDFGKRKTIRKTNADALINYSFLHLSRIKADGFLNHFDVVKAAIEADPFSVRAYQRLVQLRLKRSTLISEQVDILFDQLRAFVELNPYNNKARLLLGETYIKRGDIVNAKRIYQSLYDSYKDDSFMNYNLAITYFRIGRDYSSYSKFLDKTELPNAESATELAIKYFEKAVEIDKHLDSHLYLGVIYAAKKEYDKAVANYRYRVKNNLGPKDRFYKEAKKGLRKIFEDEKILRKYLEKEGRLKEGY